MNQLFAQVMNKQEDYQGLKNGSYFHITNWDTQLSLTYATDQPAATLSFTKFDQSSTDQIWMIEEVQQNRYQIVHAFSTLVLTANKKDAKLSIGHQNKDQLFFLQKSDPKNNPLQYWIKQSKHSDKYLYAEATLKCNVVNPKAAKTRWQLKKIEDSNELLKSCLIQFAYSGLYVDVPASSIKQNVTITQYPLNRRCNQRWKLQMVKQGSYRIVSVRSRLCLAIKGRRDKVGTEIVQERVAVDDLGQIWKFNHQGGSLYIISSQMFQNMFLGMKDNSMDQCAPLVLTDNESYAFWRVIGNFIGK